MGSETSNLGRSVNIDNSILHLFQADNNDLLFKKLLKVPQIDFNTKVNFRDDTFLHYACSRNNKEFVKYILFKNGNPYAKNRDGLRPIDLTTDEEIKETIEKYSKEFLKEPDTLQSVGQQNLLKGLLGSDNKVDKINDKDEVKENDAQDSNEKDKQNSPQTFLIKNKQDQNIEDKSHSDIQHSQQVNQGISP